MGCSALAASAIRCARHCFHDAEIVLLNYGLSNTTIYYQNAHEIVPIKCANMRLSKNIFVRNHIVSVLIRAILSRLVPYSPWQKAILSGNYYTNQLLHSDAVCSIAGGDSFSDIYGMQRFVSIVLPQFIALIMGKPLVLLPQTYGPFKGILARCIARFLLRHATIAYSRDHSGIAEAKRIVGKKGTAKGRLRFCYDVAFVLDAIKPQNFSSPIVSNSDVHPSVRVGLNISGLLYNEGCAPERTRFDLRDDYRLVIEKVSRKLLETPGVTVTLVPHVFGEKQNHQADPPACLALYRLLSPNYPGRIFIIADIYNQHELKYIIGQFDFFVGSRMHACIAALSQSVPTVGLAYSKKFAGVFESIGMDTMVSDLRTNDATDTVRFVDDAFARREEIKKVLNDAMPDIKKTVLELFCDL